MRSLVPAVALLLAAGCASRVVTTAPPAIAAAPVVTAAPVAATPPPEPVATPTPTATPIGAFKLTYYLVAEETEHRGARATTIYGEDCEPLTKVAKSFAKDLALEGTGRLADGRMLNWAGRCQKGRPKYRVLDETRPWGLGVGDRALVPFRSIATDPGVVPTGTRVYVAELDGVTMPGAAPWGGFVHDGCVEAVDVGEAIRGRHIDFFSGTRAAYHTLDGALRLRQVTIYEAGSSRCDS